MASKTLFAFLPLLVLAVGTQAKECQPVTTYAELKSFNPAGQTMRVGPNGFYADASNGTCYVLSGAKEQNFKEQYPDLAEVYATALAAPTPNITERSDSEESSNSNSTEPLVANGQSRPGCGQACDPGTDSCLYPCRCLPNGHYCVDGECFTVYKCR
ncbi:hypothetical protein EIP91_009233 [Steccherinum ochraceum]|uniref:Uncharacterized protein n=1 Tax=Steccherinum ochraceum TaxID=92696 RepID=A0A4R0RKJ7_9APHY|nr:hypothetical protein EIP91_009233 [Steccherinum ochraceum]